MEPRAQTQMSYPSGRMVQPSYDTIGRLSQISSGGTNFASGFGYNPAFEVTGFNFGNGVAASFGFSPDRLTVDATTNQITGSPYAHDTNGNMTNDAATYNAAQIGAIVQAPQGYAFGYTDPRNPYVNYTNNNNNPLGTLSTQVHELGHSLFYITKTLTPFVPEDRDYGQELEDCVRRKHGFVRR